MRKTFLKVSVKLAIAEEAITSGNIRGTARRNGVQPCQVRYWLNQREILIEKMKRTRLARTTHTGPEMAHTELESKVLDWITEQRAEGIVISSSDVVCRAVYEDPTFKIGDAVKQRRWLHQFLNRNI